MRLCLVTPFSWSQPHDVNEHVAGVATELRRLGHSVTILASSNRAKELAASRRALLDGLVVDATKKTKAIANAQIVIRDQIIPTDKAFSGALGKFKIKGVRRGVHAIEIAADGYSRYVEQIDLDDKTPPLTFAMKPSGIASGTVVDRGGRPIVGADVFVAEKVAIFLAELRSLLPVVNFQTWNNCVLWKRGWIEQPGIRNYFL